MNEPTPNDAGLLEEELVAYLDGELPDSDRARIERRLADDVSYQRKLAQLQKAWDLLDVLHKSEPDAEFTRSTVEMVAVQQEKEAAEQLTSVKRQKAVWWLAGGLAIGLLLFAGYFTVQYRLQAPERQLLKDLPVIERVDQYRQAESVEFLKRLREEGLFAGEGEDAL